MAEADPKDTICRRGMLLGAATAPIVAGAASARPGRPGRFDRERFVADCQAASPEGQGAVREALARAVADPGSILSALGEPREAGLDVLLRSPILTIFAATWTPQMNLIPHDHRMWALIGLYAGREDNIFWRRTMGVRELDAYAAQALFAGDVATLPSDVIHSVTNPLQGFTAGLHIYGGDFFAAPRSQWSAETLTEEPSDGETIRAMFARENERFRKRGG
jgi:predicted metal-dependent enzyme (double-stranded beta helix superfamily)